MSPCGVTTDGLPPKGVCQCTFVSFLKLDLVSAHSLTEGVHASVGPGPLWMENMRERACYRGMQHEPVKYLANPEAGVAALPEVGRKCGPTEWSRCLKPKDLCGVRAYIDMEEIVHDLERCMYDRQEAGRLTSSGENRSP